MLNQSLLLEPPKSESEINEMKLFNKLFKNNNTQLIIAEGQTIQIPLAVLSLLKSIIDTLDNGNAITIIPLQKELTTQQAADILNVSRPYIIQLLEKGEIPFVKTGRHRRILMSDLMQYKMIRDQNRGKNLNKLVQLSQELGLYD